MKYYNHLLILLFSLMGLSTFAQTSKKTLNYQAVILDPKAIDIPGASIVGQPSRLFWGILQLPKLVDK